MTYADGYGWASSRDTNEVNQIRSRSGGSANSSVCAGPSQTAYGHGYLFVACNGDHTLVVLAPRSMRVVGHPIPVPQNPYAVAADARGVWVTGMAGNTVTRLAYR
jgi:DNA-binding beta-propeller fold protein YncE